MAKKPSTSRTAPNRATSKPTESASKTEAVPEQKLTPEAIAQIEAMRGRLHETFGKVCLALTAMPRYRHLPLADLQSMILEPLMRDRLILASTRPVEGESALNAMSGIALWASVSPEVDAKIQEQIKAGVFPIRLQPSEWTSGSINWLFDVIAPNQQLTTSVIRNFKQVVKEGELRMHPLVSRLVDPESLKKMGARPIAGADATKGTAAAEPAKG